METKKNVMAEENKAWEANLDDVYKDTDEQTNVHEDIIN